MLRRKHLENYWLQSQYKYCLHTDAQETMHLKNEKWRQRRHQLSAQQEFFLQDSRVLTANSMHLERQLKTVVHMQFFKHCRQMGPYGSLGDQ